jgi:hypothetical protein
MIPAFSPALFMPKTGVSYIGPGNVVSGAVAWWGLRAYSGAMAGTKAINLRRDSDQGTSDFNTLANGNLDIASITTFKGAANLFVTKVYDQSGNAIDMVQATAANQPIFTLNGLGTHPVMTFVSTSSLSLNSAAIIAAQPFGMSVVVRHTGSNYPQTMIGTTAPNIQIQFSALNTVLAYTGVTLPATAADNTYHALGATLNSTSSDMNVDGTPTTGDAGTNALGAGSAITLGALVGAAFIDGQILEAGIWAANIDSSFVSLSTNQHTYWGF